MDKQVASGISPDMNCGGIYTMDILNSDPSSVNGFLYFIFSHRELLLGD
jgi:hypothetical protein